MSITSVPGSETPVIVIAATRWGMLLGSHPFVVRPAEYAIKGAMLSIKSVNRSDYISRVCDA